MIMFYTFRDIYSIAISKLLANTRLVLNHVQISHW